MKEVKAGGRGQSRLDLKKQEYRGIDRDDNAAEFQRTGLTQFSC